MRRCALFVVALLVGTAGCDDGDEEAASTTTEAPTTTGAEATTTTAAAPDPFTVPTDPADIDEAYVEAVLAELERINGDALRLAVSEGLSPRITELIQSIYEQDLALVQIETFAQFAGEGFPGIRRPPGDVAVSVSELLVAASQCISVDVLMDFSSVTEGGDPAAPLRVELRQPRSSDPSNGTPWVYVVRDSLSSPELLPEPCVAS